MSDLVSPGARLLDLWARLRPLPGGRTLFSFVLGRRIPYTGSMRARVVELEPGRARIRLRDRRRVRNHLGSIHAVALTNLGELAGGLALLTGIPPGVRGIVVRLETEYLKKARGTLTAESRWEPPAEIGDSKRRPDPDGGLTEGPVQHWIHAMIRDAAGEEVARTRALWHLGSVR